MPFKKLNVSIKESLERLEIETPTPFQQKIISKIKSGANLYGIAPSGSGKTTALIINTLQKLNCEAVGNAPRALIIVENKKEALDLHSKFIEFTKYTDVRVYMGYEELHVDVQKSEIYMGIDILISTSKNIQKLFLFNGVSLSQLKIFLVDDAEFLMHPKDISPILVTAESIKKCQYVIFGQKMTPKIEKFKDDFMLNATVIKL